MTSIKFRLAAGAHALILALSIAAPAFGQQSAVDAVDRANPELLRSNTKEADAKFSWCVAHAIGAGLLSKSDGENGHTWATGVRTSHDVIAYPDGRRVDIISGSDNAPHAGSPTWNEIPPANWRPSNVYVPLASVPVQACTGGSTDPTPPTVPTVNLKPVLDAIAALSQKLDALAAVTDQTRAEASGANASAQAAKVAADNAADRAGEAKVIAQNARDRLEDIVVQNNTVSGMLQNPPSYSGRVPAFGGSITLSPKR